MPMTETVPEVVILRLPLYVRALAHLHAQGIGVVSSHALGEKLQITPAQIRKDLSYFGRFGKQGRGYNVEYLLSELRSIVGLNQEWRAALVGVGRLGRAIISYQGFAREGFHVVAIFDVDSDLVGTKVNGGVIRSMGKLDQVIKEKGIHIGIVAVPEQHAQSVVDQLVRCGVKGILNYAPISPQVPDGVWVRNIDPVLALQTLTFHLKV
ncbi:MAG: redox-sensing transcriptional repressor Rex [Dehalococcoidia bacterium]